MVAKQVSVNQCIRASFSIIGREDETAQVESRCGTNAHQMVGLSRDEMKKINSKDTNGFRLSSGVD